MKKNEQITRQKIQNAYNLNIKPSFLNICHKLKLKKLFQWITKIELKIFADEHCHVRNKKSLS